jgi:hypothetical protein
VQIDTPLSTDSNGNLFFGFLVLGSTPLNLQSGLARISANGTGTWVSAAALSGDPPSRSLHQLRARALGRRQHSSMSPSIMALRIPARGEQHDARA